MLKGSDFIAVLSCLLMFACQRPPEYQQFPKIDTHVHLRTYDASFVQQAKSDNFQLLTIAVRAGSQARIDEQNAFMLYQKNQFPETVAWATTFSMEGWGTPGWQETVLAGLKREFEQGAIAVKVLKDIGMTFRKPDSSFILIDDASFDPIFDFIAAQGKTLVAHTGEPKNCWLPLDRMTVNSDRNYFRRNPEYHMYLHPEYPSYEDQVNARDHMLEKHPDLRVIGAHLGSLEWNVDELAKRLDKFPNLAVDMAARICHFQVQDRDKVRDFFTKYQDRLIYATDLGQSDNSNAAQVQNNIHTVWQKDWQYFTTDDNLTADAVPQPFRGINLPVHILKKIYSENARKWLPGFPE
jgi:predicted TIM-barrel fold metal-dependent hydrolase